MGIVAGLDEDIAVSGEGGGQLAVDELVFAQVGIVSLAAVVGAVDVADQVVVYGGHFGLGGLFGVAQSQGAVLIFHQGEFPLGACGHEHLLTLVLVQGAAGGVHVAFEEIPVGIVAGLDEDIAVSGEGGGQLAVHELILAQVGIVSLTAIVSAVDVTDQVVVHGGLSHGFGDGDRVGGAGLAFVVIAGHVQLQGHIGQSVLDGQGDVLTVVDSLTLSSAAAPAVGPAAVGGEFELIGGACGNVLEGDLIDAFGGFGHDIGGGVPAGAVKPSAGAVAHRVHGGDLQAGLLAHTVAGYGDDGGFGIKGDSHVTDSGNNEGVVVCAVGFAPGIVPGAVGDLQVVGACGNIGEDLLIGAVGGQGHPVVGVGGVPLGAAQGLVTGHHIQGFVLILRGIGSGFGSGGRGFLRLLFFAVDRPDATALVPGAVGHGVQIGAVGGNSQVRGLVPLAVPAVFFYGGVHAAEDNVVVAGGDGAFVDTVLVGTVQIGPGVAATGIPAVDGEPCAVTQPVGVGLQVQRGFLGCRVGMGYGDHTQQHDKCQRQAQDPLEKIGGYAFLFHDIAPFFLPSGFGLFRNYCMGNSTGFQETILSKIWVRFLSILPLQAVRTGNLAQNRAKFVTFCNQLPLPEALLAGCRGLGKRPLTKQVSYSVGQRFVVAKPCGNVVFY